MKRVKKLLLCSIRARHFFISIRSLEHASVAKNSQFIDKVSLFLVSTEKFLFQVHDLLFCCLQASPHEVRYLQKKGIQMSIH